MGSAQAIVNVPASHMAGQQHAKHYLRVPRQSASEDDHLKGLETNMSMTRKYRCGNKVPTV